MASKWRRIAAPRKAPRLFRPGYDRTGGFYGKPELKFFDTVLGTNFANNGVIAELSLNLIPQGTTESERIGRKCTLVHIGWNWQCTAPAQTVSTSVGGNYRMIMYLDKQCNGATAAVLDILKETEWRSFYNVANRSRFNILCDKIFTIQPTSGAGDTANQHYARTFKSGTWKKTVNIPLEFSSTTGVITELKSNNIGLLLISDSVVGNTFLSGSIRVRFTG